MALDCDQTTTTGGPLSKRADLTLTSHSCPVIEMQCAAMDLVGAHTYSLAHMTTRVEGGTGGRLHGPLRSLMLAAPTLWSPPRHSTPTSPAHHIHATSNFQPPAQPSIPVGNPVSDLALTTASFSTCGHFSHPAPNHNFPKTGTQNLPPLSESSPVTLSSLRLKSAAKSAHSPPPLPPLQIQHPDPKLLRLLCPSI